MVTDQRPQPEAIEAIRARLLEHSSDCCCRACSGPSAGNDFIVLERPQSIDIIAVFVHIDTLRQQLAEYQKSFALCEVHTPDLWEGDGSCVICEAVEQNRKLAEAEAERDRLMEQHEYAREMTDLLKMVRSQYEALTTALALLVETWRTENGDYPESKQDCADDLIALLDTMKEK